MPMPPLATTTTTDADGSSTCHVDGAACAPGRDECCHGSVCAAASGVCTPVPGSLPLDAPCRRDADCASTACVQVPKGAAAAVGLATAPRVCGVAPTG